MGITNFKHSMEKRYSALAGELIATRANIERIKREVSQLEELEARIPQLEALINSAEMLLRDAHPEWTPDQTPPVQPWTHQLPVAFGSCGRRGMEVLRKAKHPLTCREIALEVLRGVGCEDPDRKLVHRTLNAIEASLRKHKGRSVESSGKYPAQWRSIVNPDVQFDV